jgi:hypothetical protein
MAIKTLPKSSEKPPTKITIPMSKKDLHQTLDMVMEARTVSGAFGETLLQTLFAVKCQQKAQQTDLAHSMRAFLIAWVKEGGAQ